MQAALARRETLRLLAHLRRRCPVAAAKDVVEMRQVAKAGPVGDGADGPARVAGIAKHLVREIETFVARVGGECGLRLLE